MLQKMEAQKLNQFIGFLDQMWIYYFLMLQGKFFICHNMLKYNNGV